MTARDDARDAGLLLRYGIDHHLSPARHDTYSRLLDRYQADPDLRSCFDETAAAMGVRVLAADRITGLAVSGCQTGQERSNASKVAARPFMSSSTHMSLNVVSKILVTYSPGTRHGRAVT